MKVTYNWLKDYIKLPLSPEQLGEKFSSLGIAVETVTPVGFDISGVVVGQIEKIEKHPNADKLVYCSVNTGSGTKNIVCGATNMKERDKVPVALDGAFLPGDFKISDRKVREILSEGMMCSGKELGILEDAGGLLILPEDAPLGKDIVEYLQLKDWVYELEILPNRPDYLGTIGVARMLSAALKLPLTLPKIDLLEAPKETAASAVMVTIKDATLCPRYTARVIKGVRPGEAPLWMKIRLARSGIRPISNIVDITNYVLLEAGHPLHAFDLKLLSGGEIIVRRAAVGEELTTLDGVKRKMAAENLVIADADRAVALAGIMGGKTAEITSVTTDILLESAYFDPVNIRKTSKALNISTEASFRFERGMDIEGLVFSQGRAAALIKDICGGIILKGMLDAYPVKQKPVSVRTRFERVRKLLGADINNSEMLDIAVRLGFKITEKDAQGFSADVPSFRVELSREIDMIEEIAQVYGYENIADRVPKAGLFASVPSTKFEDTLKNELVMRGMWEAVNWGFMPKGWFAKAGIAKESSFCDCLELLNPLTDEWNVMRPSLFPGLLGNVVRNVVSQGNRNIKLFETGNVFSGKADEHKNLGIIITGNMNEESWLNKPEDAGFFYLKGLVEGFLNGLGIILEIKQAAVEICEPGRSCEVLVNGREAGYFGEVKKNILKNFDLKQEVFFAEFSLPALLQGADFTRKFTALPKFPSIRRDTSFVVPAGLEAERITAHILSLQEPLIEKAALVFVYEGEQVGPGKKSLTYSIVFRDAGRTLTDKTVDEVNGRLVNGVINSFGVTVRK